MSSKVVLKFLVVGEVDVGKTSLLLSYNDPENDPKAPPPTSGVDVLSVQTTIDGRPVTVQLWDTAGQERFRVITSSFYKGAHGVMLAYDTTCPETFEPLKAWDADVDRYHGNPSMLSKMVVGTKIDLKDQRAVTEEEGKAVAQALGKDVLFAETTVFDRDTVLAAFQKLLEAAYARYKAAEEERNKAAAGNAGEAGDVVRVKNGKKGKKKSSRSCLV